jgi:hypothetical protein
MLPTQAFVVHLIEPAGKTTPVIFEENQSKRQFIRNIQPLCQAHCSAWLGIVENDLFWFARQLEMPESEASSCGMNLCSQV